MRVHCSIAGLLLLPVLGFAQAQQAPPAPTAQPSPSLVNPQPVTAVFRKLLAAQTEEERQALLSDKPTSTQKTLLEKIEEYRALDPTERERRLRLLDLRAYITQLRPLQPTDRAAAFQQIPEQDRQIVRERLAVWDSLTPTQQHQMRLYDITQKLLVAAPLPPSPPGFPRTPQQARIDHIAERWHAYPAEQRAEIVAYFKRIFEDAPETPAVRLANALSLQERQQIQQTLEKLRNLPATQRDKCLNGFTRFIALPQAGRAQFMDNVTIWKGLTPDARAALTNLTEHLPPLPPDFYNPPPPPAPDFPGTPGE